MKRMILSAVVVFAGNCVANAQAVNDTVNTTAGYANNVWYSLENDDAGSVSASNWHLALSPTTNPSNPMTTSVQFNRKLGKVYEIPGSDVTDFAGADTAGLSTWIPLENSEATWAAGALNNTTSLGSLDFGFGTYNTSNHSIEANRIFVAKLNDGTYYKFILTLEAVAGNWKVTYDRLDNSDSTTTNIAVAGYATKNYVYLNFDNDQVIDREPAKTAWDLWFGQYKYVTTSTAPGTPELITGVFGNNNVEFIQVDGVNATTYEDYLSGEWNDSMNVIGSDWKTYGTSWTTSQNRVYFIDDVDGNVWKVVMTYFSGTGAGKYGFTKEKLGTVGLDEKGEAIIASVYPNPAADKATVVVKNVNGGTVNVYSITGQLVYAANVSAAGMTAFDIPVADFANGTYQVVVSGETFTTAQKLIVQH